MLKTVLKKLTLHPLSRKIAENSTCDFKKIFEKIKKASLHLTVKGDLLFLGYVFNFIVVLS